ncbi:MAG: methylmalonyl Co-A mutase-associated GTPase MeaB [Burkholderiales bacterium]|nr:methylmalonyl Co-A mutase-associated GTPase MeaB [Burkholderiales bacterium]
MSRTEHPLVQPLLAGDRRAIARAITAFEVDAPAARAIAAAIAPRLGRAHVIGITGAPGAGKSTLINALLGELLARGRRIGVVAVDPSSPISGGAVLGDRVRMAEHGGHENVFVRSVASRGHLGGLSRATSRMVDVLDAAGFDTIVVETVGAGQSEVEIVRVADTRIVVCPPGLGDDIQAIKAGILEIADILVVNKGDSPLAERTARDLKDMLHLRRHRTPPVKVLVTVATTGAGVPAVVDEIAVHRGAVGVGTRLRPRGEAPSVDEAAAAARALAAERTARRFLPAPVPAGAVREVLRVGDRGVAGGQGRPWRVRALAGPPLERLRQDLAAAGYASPSEGAPAWLVFTTGEALDRTGWLDYGMFLQRVLAAARARGLGACCEGALAPFHKTVAGALGLDPTEIVVCALAIGRPDPAAAAPSAEPAPLEQFAQFHGFD